MLPDYDHVQVNYDMGDLRNDGLEINFDIMISKNSEMKMKLMYQDISKRRYFNISPTLPMKCVKYIQSLIKPQYMLAFDHDYASDIEFIIPVNQFKDMINDPHCGLKSYISENLMNIIDMASKNAESKKTVYEFHKNRMNE